MRGDADRTARRADRATGPGWPSVLAGLLLVWLALLGWSTFVVLDASGDGRAGLVVGRDRLLGAEVEPAVAALAQADAALERTAFHANAPWVVPLRLLPVVGDDVRHGGELATSIAAVAASGLEVARTLESAVEGLGGVQGRLPVEVAEQLVVPTAAVADDLDQLAETMADGDVLQLSGPLDDARAEVDGALGDLGDRARVAADLVAAVPALLGADQPANFLLFASNPAELRGTGGYLGAYAEVVVEDGALRIGSFDRLSNLERRGPEAVEPPNDDFLPRYRAYGGTGAWQNVNLTPDFPSAATVIERLWELERGESLDGVLAVDPFAYEALLRIGGPVSLPGLPEVTADTVVDYVTRDAYLDFDGDPERRQAQLGAVAAAALEGFLGSGLADDLGTSVDALGEMLGGGHLRVHAADPQVQAALAAAGIDGALRVAGQDGAGGDYLGVVMNNAAANKIDSFVQRDVVHRATLREGGGVDARVEVTFFNNAPLDAPRYVVGPNAPFLEPGEMYGLLSVFCGPGCFVAEAPPSIELSAVDLRRSEEVVEDLDGRRSSELGSGVVDTWVAVPAGGSQRLEFAHTQPSGAWERTPDGGLHYRLLWDGQVTLRATALTVEVDVPEGFEVSRAPSGHEVVDGVVRWVTDGTRDRVFDVLLAPAVDG